MCVRIFCCWSHSLSVRASLFLARRHVTVARTVLLRKRTRTACVSASGAHEEMRNPHLDRTDPAAPVARCRQVWSAALRLSNDFRRGRRGRTDRRGRTRPSCADGPAPARNATWWRAQQSRRASQRACQRASQRETRDRGAPHALASGVALSPGQSAVHEAAWALKWSEAIRLSMSNSKRGHTECESLPDRAR